MLEAMGIKGLGEQYGARLVRDPRASNGPRSTCQLALAMGSYAGYARHRASTSSLPGFAHSSR